MVYWFLAPDRGYPGWLAGHPDEYVLSVDRVIKVADLPVDAAGRPEPTALRITGPVHRVIHRASCATVAALGDTYVKLCGPRDELERDASADDDVELCDRCM